MNPLPLVNRYRLDAWDESGSIHSPEALWWFSSKTHWCAAPYLEPPEIKKARYLEARRERFSASARNVKR